MKKKKPKVKIERPKRTFIKIKGTKEQAERMREYIPVIDGSYSLIAEAYKRTQCLSVAGRKQWNEDVKNKKEEIQNKTKVRSLK